MENESGQEVRIVYDIDGNRNNVEVYIDNVLTQKVQSDADKDVLQIEYLNKDSVLTNDQTIKYIQKDINDKGNIVETYRISDFIVSTDTQDSSNNSLRHLILISGLYIRHISQVRFYRDLKLVVYINVNVMRVKGYTDIMVNK